MPENKISILCTRLLDQHFITKVEPYGIQITTLPFIEIQLRKDVSFIQEVKQLAQKKINAVFTSVNAVESVSHQVKEEVDWKIFSIGGVTKDAVCKHFGDETLIASAKNASMLAKKITEKGNISDVTFFCGDQRLDDLPETLRANKINVQEIIAYHNLQTPHDVQEDYDGILFFSPTAVHSFFLMNTIRTNVVLFSIGKTTTATIQSYCSNEVITSEWPGAENLLDKALEYYKGSSQ
jgi:uroporphyrinogen-III synthase